MLNDFLLLQLFILISLVIILFTTDFFFLLCNSILFLFLVACYLWNNELDIYINFLIIIDLGVFFVICGLLLNLFTLFQSEESLNISFYKVSYYLLIFLVLCSLMVNGSYLNSTVLASVDTFVNFYVWYSILNLTYFTDLQLMSELYYVYNSFEFILMNFYLYITILLIYFLFVLVKHYEMTGFKIASSRPSDDNIYQKYQNFQKQIKQTATVRVWSKVLTSGKS